MQNTISIYSIANSQRLSIQEDEHSCCSCGETASSYSSCESDNSYTTTDHNESVAAQVLFLNVIEKLVVKPENGLMEEESVEEDSDLPEDDAAMEGIFNKKYGLKTWWSEQAKQKHKKERAERKNIKQRQEIMEAKGFLDLVSLVLA